MSARASLAVVALLFAPAVAAAQQVAEVTTRVPIAALGGWVAWSAKEGRQFRLLAWHEGRTQALPVRERLRPFDVDLGTDSRGRPVATFSRCRRFSSIAVYEVAPREVGVGCQVRVVDLASGKERAAGIPVAPGTSDTVPSMWQGRIAFARRDPRNHGNIDQVMLWSPRERSPTRLRHGAIPTSCPFRDTRGCTGSRPSGEVTGLDLGARLVAFTWRVQAPAVLGHGGFEVRLDRLIDGRSALVGSGYIGEACTGGPDGTMPATPSVDGDRAWYSRLTSDCYVYSVTLNAYSGFPVRGMRGPLDGTVLQAVKDGASLYALVAPPNAPSEGPSCTPCAVRQIAMPALQPVRLRPHSPFS